MENQFALLSSCVACLGTKAHSPQLCMSSTSKIINRRHQDTTNSNSIFEDEHIKCSRYANCKWELTCASVWSEDPALDNQTLLERTSADKERSKSAQPPLATLDSTGEIRVAKVIWAYKMNKVG
ncbi:uncharacterized protein MEPE_05094 [Melanopsichium pennsylvanicum]|uniref:Uncharacterized protein n=1 Tax=Melanopsichium pennsylvanicum TaxID=63383 RepID=A0AAJ5C6Z6_9BASI|nr:uncharacterized protein MEPE_05094 [Melanopsichium pennsylvanicum]